MRRDNIMVSTATSSPLPLFRSFSSSCGSSSGTLPLFQLRTLEGMRGEETKRQGKFIYRVENTNKNVIDSWRMSYSTSMVDSCVFVSCTIIQVRERFDTVPLSSNSKRRKPFRNFGFLHWRNPRMEGERRAWERKRVQNWVGIKVPLQRIKKQRLGLET